MARLLEQVKVRRRALGLTQADMEMKIGVSRQQYQRLEAKGNPRLDTLELVAKGLKAELLLVPDDKLDAVRAVLDSTAYPESFEAGLDPSNPPEVNDPWAGLLDGTS